MDWSIWANQVDEIWELLAKKIWLGKARTADSVAEVSPDDLGMSGLSIISTALPGLFRDTTPPPSPKTVVHYVDLRALIVSMLGRKEEIDPGNLGDDQLKKELGSIDGLDIALNKMTMDDPTWETGDKLNGPDRENGC